jgi:hypothetical protein
MLVRAHDRPIDAGDLPIELARGIGLGLQRLQDALPNALFLPAIAARTL